MWEARGRPRSRVISIRPRPARLGMHLGTHLLRERLDFTGYWRVRSRCLALIKNGNLDLVGVRKMRKHLGPLIARAIAKLSRYHFAHPLETLPGTPTQKTLQAQAELHPYYDQRHQRQKEQIQNSPKHNF